MKAFARIMPILLLASSVSIPAAAMAAPVALKLVAQQARTTLRQPVTVDLALEGDHLRARFEARTPSIHGKRRFVPKKDYPFQFDVVELFVTVAGNASNLPYFEFEITPYGQSYEVRIDERRRFEEGHFTGAQYQAQVFSSGSASALGTESHWRAEMLIPLKNLGWDGDPSKIRGNAYAIFGKPGQKTHWALSMPAATKPNFHQPQYFVPLAGE